MMIETGTKFFHMILFSLCIGKQGRPMLQFEDMSESTQFRQLDKLVCNCIIIGKYISYICEKII